MTHRDLLCYVHDLFETDGARDQLPGFSLRNQVNPIRSRTWSMPLTRGTAGSAGMGDRHWASQRWGSMPKSPPPIGHLFFICSLFDLVFENKMGTLGALAGMTACGLHHPP